jgi:hypothetical protein
VAHTQSGRGLEYCFPIVDSIRKVYAALLGKTGFIDHSDLPGPYRPIQNDWTPFPRAFHLTASQLRFGLGSGLRTLGQSPFTTRLVSAATPRPVTTSFASAFTTVPPRYQSISHSSQAAELLATMNSTPICFVVNFDRRHISSLIVALVSDHASASISGSRLTNSMTAWQPTPRPENSLSSDD